jgi:hypothetical protein
VVLHATHVGEAQVDPFDLVVLDQFFDVFERHGRGSGLGIGDWIGNGNKTAPALLRNGRAKSDLQPSD